MDESRISDKIKSQPKKDLTRSMITSTHQDKLNLVATPSSSTEINKSLSDLVTSGAIQSLEKRLSSDLTENIQQQWNIKKIKKMEIEQNEHDILKEKIEFKELNTDKQLEIQLENSEMQRHWWKKTGIFDSATDGLDFESDLEPVLRKLSCSETTSQEFQTWKEIGLQLYYGKELSDKQTQLLLQQEFEDARWVYEKVRQKKLFEGIGQQINSKSHLSELDMQFLQQKAADCEQRYVEALVKADGTIIPEDKTLVYDPDLTVDLVKHAAWFKHYTATENIEALWSRFVHHKEKKSEEIKHAFFYDVRKFARYWGQSHHDQQIPQDLRDAIKHKFKYFEKCHQYARSKESERKGKFEEAKQKLDSVNRLLAHVNEIKNTSQQASGQAENEIHHELQQHPSGKLQDNTLQIRTVERVKEDYYESINLADDKQLRNIFRFGAYRMSITLMGLHDLEIFPLSGSYKEQKVQKKFEQQKEIYNEHEKWESTAFESRQVALELRRELYNRYDEKEKRDQYEDVSLRGGRDVGQKIFEYVKEGVKPQLEEDLQPLRDRQNMLNQELKHISSNQTLLKSLEKAVDFMESALTAQERVYQALIQANSYVEELITHQPKVGERLSIYKEQLCDYKEKWQLPTFKPDDSLKQKLSEIMEERLSKAELNEKDQLAVKSYFSNQWERKIFLPPLLEETDSRGKDTLGRLKQDALYNIINTITLDIYGQGFSQLRYPIDKAKAFYVERAKALQKLRAIHEEVRSSIQDL